MHETVLVIEPSPGESAAVAEQLRLLGGQPQAVPDLHAALNHLALHPEVALVLAPAALAEPDDPAQPLLAQGIASTPQIPWILCAPGAASALHAACVGALGVLEAPLSETLPPALALADRWRLALQDPEEAVLLGSSPACTALQQHLTRLAPLRLPVLLSGEVGVGLAQVARALHRRATPSAPFAALSCAALPGEALEDACTRMLAEASGGTLLLTGIEDLSTAAQGALRRILQPRPLHAPTPCRVMAAVGDPPTRLRPELHHHLGQLLLRVPPLRERPADLLLLAWRCIHHTNRTLHTTIRHLTPAAVAYLQGRAWRSGNLLQLDNALRNAALAVQGDTLDVAHLAPAEAEDMLEDVLDSPRFPEAWLALPYAEATRTASDAFRRWYITARLQVDGSVAAAAQASGLRPANLSREISRLGLRRER